ncbi:stellacyanin [Manihot esculenta]|uniref:Phytocyanin domain-containing protein n=1 Tax=Manihot esculenta TaxID=3983 RepID=A0A2C9VSU7_MANES|nr:stellacyanin [Manihot esculenta]OAY48088.1 hypothetical protein MANES_06G130500v8 [Manihot esculenta]
MGKLALFSFLVILCFALTSAATNYIVGDSSGWDISTDLDTWAQGKNFVVGDVLVFQYSSSDSVNEVTKESFDGCNTTKVIKTYTNNGNTTVTLSRPGPWYFISGNKLYCLGGMKLAINVQGKQADISPVAAPKAQPTGVVLPQPSTKNNNPTPTSSGSVYAAGGKDSLLKASFGFVAAVLWLVG